MIHVHIRKKGRSIKNTKSLRDKWPATQTYTFVLCCAVRTQSISLCKRQSRCQFNSLVNKLWPGLSSNIIIAFTNSVSFEIDSVLSQTLFIISKDDQKNQSHVSNLGRTIFSGHLRIYRFLANQPVADILIVEQSVNWASSEKESQSMIRLKGVSEFYFEISYS